MQQSKQADGPDSECTATARVATLVIYSIQIARCNVSDCVLMRPVQSWQK